MQTKRENSYDILRILCAIGVIAIHVSAVWLTANTDAEWLGTLHQEHLLYSCLWNVIPRFAVPCFMMMSGALILSDERNADYSYFYKKQFRRIGIPWLIFVALYMLYGMAVHGAAVLIKHRDIAQLLQPIGTAIRGDNHLWYLYAMAGVYALTPIVIRFKRDIGETRFTKVTWIFLALASIGYETSTSLLSWDIGFSFRFLGYFMAGYEIRRMIRGHKNNCAGTLLILAGGGIEVVVAYVRFRQELVGISEDAAQFQIISPLCPWIVVASVCIFAGFSLLRVRRGYPRMASCTFMIYLVHVGVWDVLARVTRLIYGVYPDNRILIPFSVVSVFLISLVIAYAVRQIDGFAGKRRKADHN